MNKDIIVFAGPSGSGKSTLCHLLLNNYRQFEFSISATTRGMRLGEVNGKDYYFFTQDEFQKHIDDENFIEWEEVYPGKFYGTLKTEIDRITNDDKKAVFDIDVLGALSIKKVFGNKAHIVFVKPESIEVLKERLKDRRSESEQDLAIRIDRFEKELSYEDSFDEVIINKTGELEMVKGSIDRIVDIYFL